MLDRSILTHQKIYSFDEVSQILGIAHETLKKVIYKGELKAYSRHRQWFVFTSDLHKYIRTGKNNSKK